jgi:hypothetical protein
MTTYCPKCHHPLSVEQFDGPEQCPSCGASFDTDTYKFMIGVAVLVGVLGGIAYWMSSSDMSRKGIIIVTSAVVVVALLGTVIDKIMAKTKSRKERGQPAFWIAGFITMVIIYFTRERF